MRRSLLVFLAAMALVHSVNAGAYPDKPVRLIVPFSAGAAADSVAQPLAAKLSQYWGQQVLVENRGGLTVGAQAAAGAAADGYTLLFGAASTMVTTPLTAAKLPYDVRRDFIPITRRVTLPPTLTVNPALGVKSLKEFITLAKARPGQLNYACQRHGCVLSGDPDRIQLSRGFSVSGLSPWSGMAVSSESGFARRPRVPRIESGQRVCCVHLA